METVNQVPRWFWIAIGLVLVVTVVAIIMCNNKKSSNLSTLGTSLNNQRTNIFDSINSINSINNQY